jgi:hypothetical protein
VFSEVCSAYCILIFLLPPLKLLNVHAKEIRTIMEIVNGNLLVMGVYSSPFASGNMAFFTTLLRPSAPMTRSALIGELPFSRLNKNAHD